MNEISKPLPPANPGTNAPAPAHAPVAATGIQPAPVVSSAAKSVPLFGGHRGGGKKRADGLVAGSPEAIAADKAKDRARKNAANAAKRAAQMPPPLPAAVASASNPNPPLGHSPSSVGGIAAAAVVSPLVAGPAVVAWNQRLLERPAKLLTKILDRVRCWTLMKKVQALKLTPAQEKEIGSDLRWKDEVTADFSTALAECATVELNKRRVGGSEHSHWLNLAMCGGEMALAHMQALERLEQMVKASKEAESPPPEAKPNA